MTTKKKAPKTNKTKNDVADEALARFDIRGVNFFTTTGKRRDMQEIAQDVKRELDDLTQNSYGVGYRELVNVGLLLMGERTAPAALGMHIMSLEDLFKRSSEETDEALPRASPEVMAAFNTLLQRCQKAVVDSKEEAALLLRHARPNMVSEIVDLAEAFIKSHAKIAHEGEDCHIGVTLRLVVKELRSKIQTQLS